MGLSISKKNPIEIPWPPPKVETTEQFIERFRQVFGDSYISASQAEWLQIITAQFGTTGEGGSYWTEADLERYLASVYSRELHWDIQVARPLIYRCMLRLGSFPYLNQPAPALTFDIMRVALAILTRQHRGCWVGKTGRLPKTEAEEHGMRSLLFQSMRTTGSADEAAVVHRCEAAKDDDYLQQAHACISELNWRRGTRLRTRIYHGSPMIPVEALPPSNSADYNGVIPKDQLLSFVHICSQLEPRGKGDIAKIQERVANSSTGVDWKDVETAFGSMKWDDETFLLNGMAQLFNSFLMPSVLAPRQSITTSPKADAT